MRLQSKVSAESSPDSPSITLPNPANNPCAELGSYLQLRWNEAMGETSIQLRCAPRQSQLLVLLEHAIAEQPPVAETFRHIQVLLEEAPESLWLAWLGDVEELPDVVSTSLFMRVAHQKRSYADQQYEINLLSGVAPGMLPLEPEEAIAPHGDLMLEGLLAQPQAGGALDANPSQCLETDEVPFTGESIPAFEAQASGGSTDSNFSEPEVFEPADPSISTLALRPKSLDEGSAESAEDAAVGATTTQTNPSFPDRETPLGKEPLHIPKGVWAAGLSLCLATFVGSFYVASRPCLFNTCPALTFAEKQGREATELLQAANTWEDIEQSRQQFEVALKSLRLVPSWSSFGAEAQGLRGGYRKLLASLTPVQDAFQQAAQAEEKTRLGTVKQEHWQEIQAHWEAAIAQLGTIPPQSPLYALAQDKLKQFELNRAQAQVSLENEQEGQRLLQEARGYLTNLAANESDPEDSLRFLQQTESRLEDAIFTLKKVPKGTTAYRDAVRLLSNYQSELAINKGQQSKETFIVDSYREALLYAEDAKRAEGENRWNNAKDHWQTALNRIDQIPAKSPYFNKAQSLVTEYTYALKAAEQRAEQQVSLSKVEAQLEGLCAGSPKVCTYEVTPSKLTVQLTLDYERAVLTAGTVGDEDSRVGALRHVQELENALEESSNAAQIPLELYDPDGVLVGTHAPRQG